MCRRRARFRHSTRCLPAARQLPPDGMNRAAAEAGGSCERDERLAGLGADRRPGHSERHTAQHTASSMQPWDAVAPHLVSERSIGDELSIGPAGPRQLHPARQPERNAPGRQRGLAWKRLLEPRAQYLAILACFLFAITLVAQLWVFQRQPGGSGSRGVQPLAARKAEEPPSDYATAPVLVSYGYYEKDEIQASAPGPGRSRGGRAVGGWEFAWAMCSPARQCLAHAAHAPCGQCLAAAVACWVGVGKGGRPVVGVEGARRTCPHPRHASCSAHSACSWSPRWPSRMLSACSSVASCCSAHAAQHALLTPAARRLLMADSSRAARVTVMRRPPAHAHARTARAWPAPGPRAPPVRPPACPTIQNPSTCRPLDLLQPPSPAAPTCHSPVAPNHQPTQPTNRTQMANLEFFLAVGTQPSPTGQELHFSIGRLGQG
jgi:hypothetical protein